MHYVLKEEEMSGKANKVERISLGFFFSRESYFLCCITLISSSMRRTMQNGSFRFFSLYCLYIGIFCSIFLADHCRLHVFCQIKCAIVTCMGGKKSNSEFCIFIESKKKLLHYCLLGNKLQHLNSA